MFEQATRIKLRFETTRGMVSAEDLWDLPLTSRNGVSLDDLAKQLNKKLKESEEESFVVKRSTVNAQLQLQFDIVKHVIDVRLQEKETSKKASDLKQKKEKLLALRAEKEDENLKSLSTEDIDKMLADLES